VVAAHEFCHGVTGEFAELLVGVDDRTGSICDADGSVGVTVVTSGVSASVLTSIIGASSACTSASSSFLSN
jgi:hypothetical protein